MISVFKRGKEGAFELETNVISIPGKTNKQMNRKLL